MLESLHKHERRGVVEIPIQQPRPAAGAVDPDTRVSSSHRHPSTLKIPRR